MMKALGVIVMAILALILLAIGFFSFIFTMITAVPYIAIVVLFIVVACFVSEGPPKKIKKEPESLVPRWEPRTEDKDPPQS
jgi:predicted membrane protein